MDEHQKLRVHRLLHRWSLSIGAKMYGLQGLFGAEAYFILPNS